MNEILNVRVCVVASVDDDKDANRIKVKLEPEDNGKSLENIPYAIPLLPQMIHIKPKVGEAVLLLLGNLTNGNSERYYIGPIISQLDKIYSEQYELGSDRIFPSSIRPFAIAPSMKPETSGVFPKDDDVAILGRKNCDVILSDDELQLRSGVKVVNEKNKREVSFNNENPGYLKMKYHGKNDIHGNKSSAILNADKIFLLSNNSKKTSFDTNNDDLISDEDLGNLINEGYRLPYGEELVDFLLKFVKIFAKHTHKFPMLPAFEEANEILELSKEPLNNKKILSDTVIIN